MLDPMVGPWQELKQVVKSKWGELTDDDVDEFNGRSDVLIEKIQQRYGCEKEQAQREVEQWLACQPC